MALTFNYPTNVTLETVIQEYGIGSAGLLGEKILPVEDSLTQRVAWDEMDNERGLTKPHVMGTDPVIDLRPASKVREYTPIPFKQSDLIKEDELLRARELGTLGGVINLNAMVARVAKARYDKTRLRQELMRWQTLRGRLTLNENGVFVDETFPVQQYVSTIPWTSFATARPLADFNAIKLLFRGTGATIQGAKAYMNQTTFNYLLENQNAADIKGFQNQNYVQVSYSLDDVNKILSSRGLPEIVIDDEGYYDDFGIYRTFVEDGDVHVVGKRTLGEKIGAWMATPTFHKFANGLPAPGYFSLIEVNGHPSTGSTTVSGAQLGAGKNPKIEITGGVYGGTILWFARSVIRMKVN